MKMNDKFKCSWDDFKKVLETTDIMTEVCRGEGSSNGEDRRNEGATPSPPSPVTPWLKDWGLGHKKAHVIVENSSPDLSGYCDSKEKGHRQGELKYDCPECKEAGL